MGCPNITQVEEKLESKWCFHSLPSASRLKEIQGWELKGLLRGTGHSMHLLILQTAASLLPLTPPRVGSC